MKQGLTFEQLTAQVARNAAARCDFHTNANEMRLVNMAEGSLLATPRGEFALRDSAHLHLAEFTGIDRRYYTKLRQQAPELLADNVNYWLGQSGARQRLIRALDSDVRAVVSPRYATLDNDGLLRAVEPILDDLNAQAESCDLTDERMTIKLVSPRLMGEVAVGDVVQSGLVLKNSEVRAGAIEVGVFLHRLVCLNGMVVAAPGSGIHRRHVGRVWSNGEGDLAPDNAERLAWESQVWQQIQEQVRAAVQVERFQELLERLSATTKLTTSVEPQEIVERLGAKYQITPELQSRILGHLVNDYSGSLWNVANAVTRTAQDVASYEMATSLEELGGQLAHLTPKQWERLTSAN